MGVRADRPLQEWLVLLCFQMHHRIARSILPSQKKDSTLVEPKKCLQPLVLRNQRCVLVPARDELRYCGRVSSLLMRD